MGGELVENSDLFEHFENFEYLKHLEHFEPPRFAIVEA